VTIIRTGYSHGSDGATVFELRQAAQIGKAPETGYFPRGQGTTDLRGQALPCPFGRVLHKM